MSPFTSLLKSRWKMFCLRRVFVTVPETQFAVFAALRTRDEPSTTQWQEHQKESMWAIKFRRCPLMLLQAGAQEQLGWYIIGTTKMIGFLSKQYKNIIKILSFKILSLGIREIHLFCNNVCTLAWPIMFYTST